MVRLGAILAAVGILAVPAALLAHTHLLRSAPSADERLAAAPSQIRLWFSERPQVGFSRIRLLAADSTETALGAVTMIPQEPQGLIAAIPSTLAPGKYTVVWQTAGADGHVIRGRFAFTLAPAAASAAVAHAAIPAAPVAPSARPSDTVHAMHGGHQLVRIRRGDESAEQPNAYATARWVEFVALLAVLGVLTFRTAILPKFGRVVATLPRATTDSAFTDDIADSARRLGESALILLLLASLTRLYAESAAMHGAERALDSAMLRAMITSTSWGIGWLVGTAGVLVTAVGLFIARRNNAGWSIASVGALGLVVAPALTGHAAASDSYALAVTVDTLHVLGAGAWLGTLLVVLLVGVAGVRRWRVASASESSGPQIAALFHAFHPVALVCASLVLASGLISAWLRLQSLSALWDTTYGRTLLLKLAAFVIVAALGLYNSRRLLPAANDPDFRHRIRRSAAVELGFAAIVLALTAVLVSTATPESRASATASAVASP